MDEVLQSGVLEDVGGDTDDLQKEFDEAGSTAGVDKELAGMKTELATAPPYPSWPQGPREGACGIGRYFPAACYSAVLMRW